MYKIMSKKLFVIIFVCTAAVLLMACNDKTESICLPDVTESCTFEIELNSYSGTAYTWDFEINSKSGIEYVSMEFVPPNDNPDQIGGGQLIYTFKAIKAGNYKIKFEARIPWESEQTPPVESRTYKITIVK